MGDAKILLGGTAGPGPSGPKPPVLKAGLGPKPIDPKPPEAIAGPGPKPPVEKAGLGPKLRDPKPPVEKAGLGPKPRDPKPPEAIAGPGPKPPVEKVGLGPKPRDPKPPEAITGPGAKPSGGIAMAASRANGGSWLDGSLSWSYSDAEKERNLPDRFSLKPTTGVKDGDGAMGDPQSRSKSVMSLLYEAEEELTRNGSSIDGGHQSEE